MAHDELLFILNSEQYMNSRTKETPYFALRAVVELHKPYKVNDIFLCDVEPLAYPCPTIQAIEKELA